MVGEMLALPAALEVEPVAQAPRAALEIRPRFLRHRGLLVVLVQAMRQTDGRVVVVVEPVRSVPMVPRRHSPALRAVLVVQAP